MSTQTAERAGTAPAEGQRRKVLRLYGPTGSWRAAHPEQYQTDAQLRWQVEQHRPRLIKAGALALIRNRLFVIEPAFSREMLRIALEAIRRQTNERARFDREAAETVLGVDQ